MDDDIDARQTARQDAQRSAREQVKVDWQWLLSTKQGRRFAHYLLGKARLNQSSFTGNSETFKREGRRELGLELQDEMTTHDFPGYLQMLQEAKGLPQ